MVALVLRKDVSDTMPTAIDLSGRNIAVSPLAISAEVEEFVVNPVVAGVDVSINFISLAEADADLTTAIQGGIVDGAIFDSSDGLLAEKLVFFGLDDTGEFAAFELRATGWIEIDPLSPSEPPDQTPPDTDEPTEESAPDRDTDETGPAIIFDLGGIFDRSFNQSAYEGAERWADATGNSYASFELQSEAQSTLALRRFAEMDHSPIVAIGFSQADAIAEVAAEFPDADFAIIDSVVDLPNVGSYTFDVSEGAYVMGVIAATASQTGTIGFIGGMDTSLSRDYAEAFTQGATDTRAGIEVLVNMTGTTPAAWNDPVRGYELATAQMAQGADIIFTPAGATSFGVLQSIADFRGNDLFQDAYAIGNDSNLNDLHPGDVLTSLVKNIGTVVEDVFANGITVGTTELGFAEGGWSYAVDENNAEILTPAIRAAADAAIAGFSGDQGGGSPTGGPDLVTGTAADELLRGLDGNDTMTGGRGDDTIEGGAGNDTAVYSGDRASYTITLSADGIDITDRRADGDGTDRLTGIETIAFADRDWRLDIFDDVAGLSETALRSFVEVYIAYFNRAPDAEGLFFYGTAFANGTSLEASAATFLNSTEYAATYPPGLSNQAFAEAVYGNVLGRDPDPLGLSFWVSQLDSGNVSRDVFIIAVLDGAKAPPPSDATPEFIAQQQADQEYLSNKTDVGLYFATSNGLSNVDAATTAMQVFGDGDPDDIAAAITAIDGFYADALDADSGEFLIQLVGVADDPFAA